MTPDARPLQTIDDDAERDRPLRDDTRLLGRLLGDVLREQTGDSGYERVEAIRQTAIRFRRGVGAEADAARAHLASLLDGLPVGDVLHVVRAFSYFSHLANIAEDVNQHRRRRDDALAGEAPPRGTLAAALATLERDGATPASASSRRRRCWCTSSAMFARCEKYENARTTCSTSPIGRPSSSEARCVRAASASSPTPRRNRIAVCRTASTRS